MKITAETNLLVRAVMGDDVTQSPLAAALLRGAELIAVPTITLCELVWVLARGYQIERPAIADLIEDLLDTENVRVDRPAVEEGLAWLRGGGDFADAAIAIEGRRLGGTVFFSFNRDAVARVRSRGGEAALVGSDR